MSNLELVTINNGQPITTSQAVAEKFGKSHSVVLRDLRAAMTNDTSFKPIRSAYIDKRGRSRVLYLLTDIQASLLENRFMGHTRVPYGLKEDIALSVIEQLLGVKLIRQYNVGGYRIDGYDKKNNIAYEVDEGQHRIKSHIKSDKIRQKYIESEIGCKFVRINA